MRRTRLLTLALGGAAAVGCASAPAPPLSLSAAPGAPQDTILDVHYVSGGIKAGVNRQGLSYGHLIVGDTAMALIDARGGRTLMIVPMATVKEARSSVEQNIGSSTERLFLGNLAAGREEHLAVRTETTTAADVLIFRMRRKNTSQAAAAKINFRLRKSGQ